MIPESYKTCAIIWIAILWTVAVTAYQIGTLMLGVSEAYYLSQTTDLMNQCSCVWEWILSGCILNFISFTCSMYNFITTAHSETAKKQRQSNNPTCRDRCVHVMTTLTSMGLLVVGAWAINTLSDPPCFRYWQEKSATLSHFVICHVAILFISICLLVTTMIAFCCCRKTFLPME
jgi:hypothetical protein